MVSDQLGHLDIPSPGFGTLRIDEGEVSEAVRTAIETGYRNIDAAQRYGNQPAVGEGIASASVPREELFIGSKVLHPSIRETVDVDATVEDAHECLDHLGVDSLDVLYMHWPDDYDLELAFEAFDVLHDEGAFEHLGVCNFTPELLDDARELAAQPVEVLQVELHPLLQQEELRAYCTDHDITLVAYCPVIRGKAGEVPELREVAEKHGVSPYQVSIAWVASTGAVPIPKATGAHIGQNWEARNLELDDEDLRTIEAIDREDRQADPPFAVW